MQVERPRLIFLASTPFMPKRGFSGLRLTLENNSYVSENYKKCPDVGRETLRRNDHRWMTRE
jgi:hypothetical protein